MSKFETIVVWGLWLILKHTLAGRGVISGTDEIMWAKSVSEAMDDDRRRKI